MAASEESRPNILQVTANNMQESANRAKSNALGFPQRAQSIYQGGYVIKYNGRSTVGEIAPANASNEVPISTAVQYISDATLGNLGYALYDSD
ncbi:hypothetical protein LTR37_017653 [Vermiconidia calcicola]|uniref:Uncharacterized protein n=1 Tax=Vermiconidia calcicola TaxID=1690605 RepID=A0ACC3MK12_9PEZI|nr:hypothetical protein LTR37_017653 [Vermiconidia calcicola]